MVSVSYIYFNTAALKAFNAMTETYAVKCVSVELLLYTPYVFSQNMKNMTLREANAAVNHLNGLKLNYFEGCKTA